MTAVGTLRDPAIDEPSLEECHPQGTRYESPNAPIAPAYFPYNQCDVWHCTRCERHLLRYTEFGGYNVDPRVRVLDIEKIIELVFDTRDLKGCSHGAEECFHGRAVELDNLIKTGGMMTITTHNRFGTRNVHKLVAPVPFKETRLRK